MRGTPNACGGVTALQLSLAVIFSAVMILPSSILLNEIMHDLQIEHHSGTDELCIILSNPKNSGNYIGLFVCNRKDLKKV